MALHGEWARFHDEAINHVAEFWNMWWFPSHDQMELLPHIKKIKAIHLHVLPLSLQHF